MICSRASAAPINGDGEWENPELIKWGDNPVKTGWIGFEIYNFMKKNPEDMPYANIIPIVIDGDPAEGDCFHPLLKKYIDKGELKWFDFRKWNTFHLSPHKNGRRGELIDLIIAILSPCSIENFRRRDRIRKRRSTGIVTITLVFLAMLLVLGYDYLMPHSKRYQDYVFVNEIPVGLNELSKAELKECSDYYRITTKKNNRTIKLEHLNQYGTPIEEESKNHPYGPMIAVYQCRDDWKPDVVEYLDRNGIVQMTYAYATDLEYVSFQENRYVSRQVYPVASINSYGIENRMKIDRYLLELDNAGRVQYRMYMSGVNYAVNEMGIVGEKYEYDSEGHMISIRYLNSNRNVIANRNGIAGLNFGYDGFGMLDRMEYIGSDGKLEYGTEAYAYVEQNILDGKRIIKYYNTAGNLTITDMGYAVCVEKLNERMQAEEIFYYGVKSEPVYCADKFHSATISYNNHGDVVSRAYFDESGRLIQCKGGYAQIDTITDRNGNILQEDYYGSDNQPVLMDNNACTIKRKFNKGYVIEETYYGISGNRIFSQDGYFRKENKMDKRGKLIYSAFFGIEDEPVYCKEGYHAITFQYDKRENLESVSIYGTRGQLIPYSGYWATQKFKYNGGGCITDIFYIDQFGNPVDIPGNYARIENTYDDSGRLETTSYYDSDGNLSTDCYRNSVGMQMGDRFFAKVKFEYDDEENVTTSTYYDEKGELTTEYPFSTKVCKYDEVGNTEQESFYLPDGTQPKNYFNNIFYKYNSYGHLEKIEYYGYNNVPMAAGMTTGTGVHIVEASYDYRGNILERRCFDTECNETEHIVYKYNNNGLEISLEYLDSHGESALCKDGYSKVMTVYDKQGNEKQKLYLNGEELIETNEGYAICEKEFDENNVMTKIQYLDSDKNPINILAGYSCARQKVNQRGNVTELVVLDKYDTELLTYALEYNEAGQKITEALYGPDGALFAHPEFGVALKKFFYDSYGKLKREEYYGEDGQPVLAFGEWAGWESSYSNEGQEIERTYLGEDLNPRCITEGFATVKFSYDSYGREIQRSFFNEKGIETDCKFGFSRYDVEYRANNIIGNYIFYNADGDMLSDVEGKVLMVNLNLHDKNSIEYHGARYNVETGVWDQGVVAHSVYNIYRIAFESDDGDYDLMLQPYIPLSPKNQIAEYLAEVRKKYRLIVDGEPIDLNRYGEEGKIFANILKEYTQVIVEKDAEKLMKELLFDDSSETALLLSEQRGIEVTEEEWFKFYLDFYQEKLSNFYQELLENYGTFGIEYQIMDLQYYSKEAVESVNVFYKKYAHTNIEIEDMVVLNVQFVVTSEKKEAVVTDSFLFPTVQFIKGHGMWKMGRPEGAPRPSSEDILKLLGQV